MWRARSSEGVAAPEGVSRHGVAQADRSAAGGARCATHVVFERWDALCLSPESLVAGHEVVRRPIASFGAELERYGGTNGKNEQAMKRPTVLVIVAWIFIAQGMAAIVP